MVKSIEVNNRAFKVQLQYTDMLKPGSCRVLSLEDIADLEIDGLEICWVGVLEIPQGKLVYRDLDVDNSSRWRTDSGETIGLWRKRG